MHRVATPKKNSKKGHKTTTNSMRQRQYAHKGIMKWLGENDYTIVRLSNETGIPYTTLKRKVYRVTEWRFDELLRLINVTGKTFEELFSEEIEERKTSRKGDTA